MKNIPVFIFLGVAALVPSVVWASLPVTESNPLSAFQQVVSVPAVDVLVPTVVEVPLPTQVTKNDTFVVKDLKTDSFVGSNLYQSNIYSDHVMDLETVPALPSGSLMVDDRLDTYVEFPVSDEGFNTASIIMKADQAVTTSQLSIRLDEYVALPLTVKIRYTSPGSEEWRVAVSEKSMNSRFITFPQVTANKFHLYPACLHRGKLW